jgi:hypothetical protein
MTRSANFRLAPWAVVLACAWTQPSQAATQAVKLDVLNAIVTLPTPFLGGDTLVLDTLVTTQTGALSQTVNFTVGASVIAVSGDAVWQISTAAGSGPRLIGVNLDVFNNTTNLLVVSDSAPAVVGGFAVSSFAATALGPGSYRLVATGTGVRDSVLNLSLNFAAVPEAGTLALMLAGLAAMTGIAARRQG